MAAAAEWSPAAGLSHQHHRNAEPATSAGCEGSSCWFYLAGFRTGGTKSFKASAVNQSDPELHPPSVQVNHHHQRLPWVQDGPDQGTHNTGHHLYKITSDWVSTPTVPSLQPSECQLTPKVVRGLHVRVRARARALTGSPGIDSPLGP